MSLSASVSSEPTYFSKIVTLHFCVNATWSQQRLNKETPNSAKKVKRQMGCMSGGEGGRQGGMMTARGKTDGDEGMKFNLGDKLAAESWGVTCEKTLRDRTKKKSRLLAREHRQ